MQNLLISDLVSCLKLSMQDSATTSVSHCLRVWMNQWLYASLVTF